MDSSHELECLPTKPTFCHNHYVILLARDGNTESAYFCADMNAQASTSTLSASERFYPEGMRPEFDFGALGVYNAPCWSVELPDGSGGTQVVEVPRAPLVEGLPLPPNIQVTYQLLC